MMNLFQWPLKSVLCLMLLGSPISIWAATSNLTTRTVKGPSGVELNKVQYVKSSWYGDESGDTMANGQHYDKMAMTIAHKTLPFGTRLLLRNPLNGKEVIVTVKDRGPFIKGRSIDCSEGVARRLGFFRKGVQDLIAIRLDDVLTKPRLSRVTNLVKLKSRSTNSRRSLTYFLPEPTTTVFTTGTLHNFNDESFSVQAGAFVNKLKHLWQRPSLKLLSARSVQQFIPISPEDIMDWQSLLCDQPLPELFHMSPFPLQTRRRQSACMDSEEVGHINAGKLFQPLVLRKR